jgi:hypothetical protein
MSKTRRVCGVPFSLSCLNHYSQRVRVILWSAFFHSRPLSRPQGHGSPWCFRGGRTPAGSITDRQKRFLWRFESVERKPEPHPPEPMLTILAVLWFDQCGGHSILYFGIHGFTNTTAARKRWLQVLHPSWQVSRPPSRTIKIITPSIAEHNPPLTWHVFTGQAVDHRLL